MIVLIMKILFCLCLLNFASTSAATNNSVISSSTPSSNLENDVNIFIWDKNSKDFSCTFNNDEMMCESESFDNYSLILPTNLKIKDTNFTLKKIIFVYYAINVLKKGQVMPGREHSIEEIEFQMNRIKEIQSGTFDAFTSLKILKIHQNLLSSINESVLTQRLGKTLLELNLGNQLEYIPSTAFKYMTKLEKLTLTWNDDYKVPLKDLFHPSLSNLKYLQLRGYMEEIDENLFDNLISLEHLHLSFHNMASVPLALNELSNLRVLEFYNTGIINFNTQNLTNNFANLTSINMYRMFKLESFDDCAFCSFPNLETIDIEGCPLLETIHDNAFGNVGTISNETVWPKLKNFTVRFCKLSTLSEKLLPWDTIEHFRIDPNEFICDCSMAWLINDYANKSPKYVNKLITYSLGLKCAGPEELKGKHFDEISTLNCSTNFTISSGAKVLVKEPKNRVHQVKTKTTMTPKMRLNYSSTKSDTSKTFYIVLLAIILLVGLIISIFYY